MKKLNLFCLVAALLAFVINPIVAPLQAANEYASIKLPTGKTYKVTKVQVEALKNQPGIQFSEALPEKLPGGQFAVAIPKELGGGYIIGTAQAIASAFNSAGITVGLTAAEVSGAAVTTGIGIIVASWAGILAAALSGGRGAAAHHHAPSHH